MDYALHTIVETAEFLRDARSAGLDDSGRELIVRTLAANPMAGDEVVGSGGVRKVRIAGRGKGKSGGYRVMAAYVGADAPVYLLALLSKGERSNFTDAEVKAMKALTTVIRQAESTRSRAR
jgi:hypothetical protein